MGLGFFYRLWADVTGSHPRDGTAIVSDSFITSTQTFRSVESRSTISGQDSRIAKFAIGDVVIKDKGGTGTVRAIFTTMAGELCYAVEHEGALDFVQEAK